MDVAKSDKYEYNSQVVRGYVAQCYDLVSCGEPFPLTDTDEPSSDDAEFNGAWYRCSPTTINATGYVREAEPCW